MSHDPLEKSVHSLLRNQPDRPAPETLEARVMAAIAARESLAWWQRPFMQWPAFWRALFLVVSVLIGAATVAGFLALHKAGPGHLFASFHFGPWVETLSAGHTFATIGHALRLVGDALPSLVPRDWALSAAALYSVVILLLFGSYRMLARSI